MAEENMEKNEDRGMAKALEGLERPDGEAFFCRGRPYRCVSIGDGLCNGCSFRKDVGEAIDEYACTMPTEDRTVFGPCGLEDRSDGEDVVFVPCRRGDAFGWLGKRVDGISSVLRSLSDTGDREIDGELFLISEAVGRLSRLLGAKEKEIRNAIKNAKGEKNHDKRKYRL